MPLIGPIVTARLRRHWQLVGATSVFLLFVGAHLTVFQPAARRHQLALKRASHLGLALDPEQLPPMMPPRLLTLLTENSLPPTAAAMQPESGTLTAALLEDLARLTNHRGMKVMATEPGATSQEAKTVQVRAHLKIQCSFGQFVAFLDDLSRSNSLTSVDRFGLVAGSADRHTLDLWVTRCILKQIGSPR